MNTKLLRKSDAILGRIACPVLYHIGRVFHKEKVKNTHRAAFVKLWTLGDSILTLPAIKQFKHKYPYMEVTVIASKRSADAYRGHDFIDLLKIFEPKMLVKYYKHYDVAFDLDPYLNASACITRMLGKRTRGFLGQFRSLLYDDGVRFDDQQHMSQTWSDLIFESTGERYTVEQLVPLLYSKEDIRQVNYFFKNHGIKGPYVCICASCAESAKHRSWPYFGELIGWFNHHNIPVILIGGPNERKELTRLTNVHHAAIAAGKLSFHQAAYLLKNARLMISNDTGPMHLAACMDTQTIGLFGGNLPIRYRPLNKKSKSITKSLDCSPCINTHLGSFKECNNAQCMKQISTDEVIREVYPYVQDLIV